MASIPFASRYRMCDFILSSMVHSGIDNISIIVRKNYHSLLDHLGAGREWDLVRKNGGLNIVPPFAQKQVKVFEGRIEALESLRGYLLKQPQKYVIMTDANIAINFDFNELGRYFSALSNGANLIGKQYAWLVFGVTDKTHEFVNTNYRRNSNINGLKKELKRKESFL